MRVFRGEQSGLKAGRRDVGGLPGVGEPGDVTPFLEACFTGRQAIGVPDCAYCKGSGGTFRRLRQAFI